MTAWSAASGRGSTDPKAGLMNRDAIPNQFCLRICIFRSPRPASRAGENLATGAAFSARLVGRGIGWADKKLFKLRDFRAEVDSRSLRGYDKSHAAEGPLSPADNRREARIAERTCRGWLWGRGQGEGAAVGPASERKVQENGPRSDVTRQPFHRFSPSPCPLPIRSPTESGSHSQLYLGERTGRGDSIPTNKLPKNAQRSIPSVAEVFISPGYRYLLSQIY